MLSIWGLAAWGLLSAAWAASPGDAVEGGARTVLYAALATIALLTLPHARQAIAVGKLAIGGIAVIALATYIGLIVDGPSLFLAGRLDDPVGYRNATAALFSAAFWPFIAAAATRRVGAGPRASAAALAALVLGLAFLTQSLGMVLGFLVGCAVALGLGPERLRRAWAAVLIVGGIAVFHGPLLRPYDAFLDDRTVTAGQIGDATLALGVLTVVAFALGLLIALFDGGLRPSDRFRAGLRRVAVVTLTAATVVGAVAATVAVGNPIRFVDERAEEFTALDETLPEDTRLGAVGGQRYDLWRVALNEAWQAPVRGAGEGSYRFGYYQERRTDRNLSDPHSLPLKIVAELGVVGALLLLGFLASIAACFARGWQGASATSRRWASGLAAGGAVVIGQSTVDWLWLIPGLAGLGLVLLGLAAAIVCEGDLIARSTTASRRLRLGAAGVLLVAVVGTAALYLSDLYVREARSEQNAEARLDAARTAHSLNPLVIEPLHLEAGALETMERREEARAALIDALDREPENFAVLGLLGDLAARSGNLAAARGYYREALELNPRDTGLRQLAEIGQDREPGEQQNP